MKKSLLIDGISYAMVLFISVFIIPNFVHAQEKGTFTDARDGRVYKCVKVGNLTWMAENLRFNFPAMSWVYNNDSVNEANHGRLYSWKAAQTACPKGWHLPSDKEWGMLVQSLGAEAGLKLQAMDTIGKSHAIPSGPAATSSLLGGVRHPDGSCIGMNFWGGCWSSGKINDTVGSNVLFARGAKDVGVSSNDKNSGFSVRCVKK